MTMTEPMCMRVALLYAGESLVEQMTRWAADRSDVELELVGAERAGGIRAALRALDVAVLDATAHPERVAAALPLCLEQLEPGELSVYTERTVPALEIFVRSRGVPLVLGPMGSFEWDGLMQSLMRARCWGMPGAQNT
jgi:hypothetical protein